MIYQLGIDTGGTYTDVVIVDSEQNVVATNKCLTTAQDLTIGINNAIDTLPAEYLKGIDLVSLSTTLSTNSVIEGRGASVCLLLPGYNDQQIERSGLYDIMPHSHIVAIAGGHDASGNETQALDIESITDIVQLHKDSVSAFAVSSIFSSRNTSHENEIRKLIESQTEKPVVCGHELVSSLGAPQRALTTALNARMLPHIQTLIGDVERVLSSKKITAPLMIVKGDGSLIKASLALRKPVLTILSGPAASAVGARSLSGKQNAIIADMGGTTTDITIIQDGKTDICEEGARIGDWQPMVEAIRIFSVGLGGDSEVRFNGKMTISPRRVIPLSLLVHQHPELLACLERQWETMPNPRHNRFAIRLQCSQTLINQLTKEETRAWTALENGPLEMDILAESDRRLSRSIARLERRGLVIYSGFTPTDATHVLGISSHWSIEAATLAARLWARQMRYLYGCGNWENGDAVAPCQGVFDLVVREIATKIIEAGLNHHALLDQAQSLKLTTVLTDLVLRTSEQGDKVSAFNLCFDRNVPLVAVGGPSSVFFPHVAKLLGLELVLPRHAKIASAVGAVMASVSQSVHVTVSQPSFGTFLVFHNDQPQCFTSLEPALTYARTAAQLTAYSRASESGAQNIQTSLRETAEHVKHDIDGELFISSTVTAIATGSPLPASVFKRSQKRPQQ